MFSHPVRPPACSLKCICTSPKHITVHNQCAPHTTSVLFTAFTYVCMLITKNSSNPPVRMDKTGLQRSGTKTRCNSPNILRRLLRIFVHVVIPRSSLPKPHLHDDSAIQNILLIHCCRPCSPSSANRLAECSMKSLFLLHNKLRTPSPS